MAVMDIAVNFLHVGDYKYYWKIGSMQVKLQFSHLACPSCEKAINPPLATPRNFTRHTPMCVTADNLKFQRTLHALPSQQPQLSQHQCVI